MLSVLIVSVILPTKYPFLSRRQKDAFHTVFAPLKPQPPSLGLAFLVPDSSKFAYSYYWCQTYLRNCSCLFPKKFLWNWKNQVASFPKAMNQTSKSCKKWHFYLAIAIRQFSIFTPCLTQFPAVSWIVTSKHEKLLPIFLLLLLPGSMR